MPPRFIKPLVANMFLFLLVLQPVFVVGADLPKTPPLIMALSSAPKTLDSRLAVGGTSARIVRLLSLPLIRIGADFKPQPMAAQKFYQQNGTTLVFELGNYQFTDGTFLKAEHVKAFYESIRIKGSRSPFKGSLAPLHKITASAPEDAVQSVSFIFKEKIPPFVWRLFEHPLMRVATNVGLNNGCGDITLCPIGLGPYFVAGGSTLSKVQLQLSPYWRGARPKSAQLQFKVVKDPLVRLLKVQRGEAHILQNDMPAVFFEHGEEKAGLNILKKPSTNYTYLGFNFKDPALRKKEVRQALLYAINNTEIINTLLFGFGRPAQSLLPKTHPSFWPAPKGEYAPEKAIRLLEEAGYIADENGVRLQLRLSTTTSPSVLLFAQALAAQLKKVGIDLKINAAEWGSFYGNVLKGNFQLYLLKWVGVFDVDIYHTLFHSSQTPPYGANRGYFVDSRIDGLIADVMQNCGYKQGVCIPARRVQKYQYQEVLYIPLWQQDNIALLHPSVRGFSLSADGNYDGLLKAYVKSE